jgi:cytochrome c oxidase cbb3-type subunit 3
MLTSFWHWYVIIITIVTILGCFWLLQWTKGISNRDEEGDGTGTTGHVWDEDLVELNNPLPKWWLQLFYGTIIFAFIYLVLFGGLGNIGGVLGWSQEGQYEEQMKAADEAQEVVFSRYREMDNETLIADAEATATGQRLFANSCAMCHGSDARGARGFPNLTDGDWLWGGSEEAITTTIRMGRSGIMPVLAPALGGDAGVDNMTQYVLSLSGAAEADADAMSAQPMFIALCSACHAADGSGNQILGGSDLTDDIWLYGSSAEAVRTTILEGRNGVMPAHGELLGENRSKILAAYVASLSRTAQ